MRPRAHSRKRLFRILLPVFGVAFVLLVEEIVFRLQEPPIYSTGPNAIWLRHSWIDKEHTDKEYRNLVARLHRMRIVDVYFHAGPLDSNGTVDQAKLDGSARLIRHIKKLDPGIRLQPWLGQVAEFGGGGPLNLRSPKVRAEIVRTAGRFLNLDADGFHVDLEPIYSGDQDFLELLRELHKLTESRGAMLSVAAYKPERLLGLEKAARLIARNPGYWDRDYFLAVANEVDQVAIMYYDSGVPLPGLYGRGIAWTAEWAVKNAVDNLYIGIPTYEAGGWAHFAWAENMVNAIHGLKLGVSRLDKADRKKVGAAIFAEWTTSASEERSFRKYWLEDRKDLPPSGADAH